LYGGKENYSLSTKKILSTNNVRDKKLNVIIRRGGVISGRCVRPTATNDAKQMTISEETEIKENIIYKLWHV